jgi:hypothetical protein
MVDFNKAPYYDDFDENKKFLQVLFQPGRPVQARELTQLQTILQNQIEQGANHIFKQGAKVFDAEVTGSQQAYDPSSVRYIKLNSNDKDGNLIDVSNFIGKNIKKYNSVDGDEVGIVLAATANAGGDPATLFVKWNNSIPEDIQSDLVLRTYDPKGTITSYYTANVSSVDPNKTGLCSVYSTTEGIYYVNGRYVRAPAQTIVIGKYTSNATYQVGFNVVDEIVTSSEDSSLLDPSSGFSNYTGSGADRLKVSLVLATRGDGNSVPQFTSSNTLAGVVGVLQNPENSTEFIEIARVVDGQIVNRARTPLHSEIEKSIARARYDQTGHFTTDAHLWITEPAEEIGFNIPGGSDSFRFGVSGGKSYIHGYEYDNTGTVDWVKIPKARESKKTIDRKIPLFYSNYVLVHDVQNNTSEATETGTSVIPANGFFDGIPQDRVSLFSQDAYITGGSLGANVPVNSLSANIYNSILVGTARAEYFVYDPNASISAREQSMGDKGRSFRLYLRDFKPNYVEGTANGSNRIEIIAQEFNPVDKLTHYKLSDSVIDEHGFTNATSDVSKSTHFSTGADHVSIQGYSTGSFWNIDNGIVMHSNSQWIGVQSSHSTAANNHEAPTVPAGDKGILTRTTRAGHSPRQLLLLDKKSRALWSDAYNGAYITITSGPGAGDQRKIIDYVGGSTANDVHDFQGAGDETPFLSTDLYGVSKRGLLLVDREFSASPTPNTQYRINFNMKNARSVGINANTDANGYSTSDLRYFKQVDNLKGTTTGVALTAEASPQFDALWNIDAVDGISPKGSLGTAGEGVYRGTRIEGETYFRGGGALLGATGKMGVQTLAPDETYSNTVFVARRTETVTSVTPGSEKSISIGAHGYGHGQRWFPYSTGANPDLSEEVMHTFVHVTDPLGRVVDFSNSALGGSISIDDTSGSDSVLKMTVPSNSPHTGGTYKVSATVINENISPKKKTLIRANVVGLAPGVSGGSGYNLSNGQITIVDNNNTSTGPNNSLTTFSTFRTDGKNPPSYLPISLGISDAYSVIVIDTGSRTTVPTDEMVQCIANGNIVALGSTGATNITDNFIFDNGQRDHLYDHASLKIKSEDHLPIGQCLALVNYFKHPESIINPGVATEVPSYFSVDSYQHTEDLSITALSGDAFVYGDIITSNLSGVVGKVYKTKKDGVVQVIDLSSPLMANGVYESGNRRPMSNLHFQIGDGIFTTNAVNGAKVKEAQITGVANLEISYVNIPEFTGESRAYSLRDVVDYRPRRQDGDVWSASPTIENVVIPIDSSSVNLDKYPSVMPSYTMNAYSGRIDSIYLDKFRKVQVKKGIPSEYPVKPVVRENEGMVVFEVSLPPYTFSHEHILVKPIKNQRYTVKDIGRIDDRVKTLEYYVALSSLERAAKDENVTDSEGLSRFKNGILTDNFNSWKTVRRKVGETHTVVGLSFPPIVQSNYALDTDRGYLRPASTIESASWAFTYKTGINTTKSGINNEIITLSYDSVSWLHPGSPYQLMASETSERDSETGEYVPFGVGDGRVNINPFSMFNFNGFMSLTPNFDNFIDVIDTGESRTTNMTGLPDHVLEGLPGPGGLAGMASSDMGQTSVYNNEDHNFESPLDPTENYGAFNKMDGTPPIMAEADTSTTATPFESYYWSSGDHRDSYHVQAMTKPQEYNIELGETFFRAFSTIDNVPQITLTKLENNIVEIDVAAYMRPKDLSIAASGLKPQTELFGHFDGIGVDSYISTADKIQVSGESCLLGRRKIAEGVGREGQFVQETVSISGGSAKLLGVNGNTVYLTNIKYTADNPSTKFSGDGVTITGDITTQTATTSQINHGTVTQVSLDPDTGDPIEGIIGGSYYDHRSGYVTPFSGVAAADASISLGVGSEFNWIRLSPDAPSHANALAYDPDDFPGETNIIGTPRTKIRIVRGKHTGLEGDIIQYLPLSNLAEVNWTSSISDNIAVTDTDMVGTLTANNRDYYTLADPTGAPGTVYTATDRVGEFYGTFHLPKNDKAKFTVGSKTLTLNDRSDNNPFLVKTWTSAPYFSSGSVHSLYDGIMATRDVVQQGGEAGIQTGVQIPGADGYLYGVRNSDGVRGQVWVTTHVEELQPSSKTSTDSGTSYLNYTSAWNTPLSGGVKGAKEISPGVYDYTPYPFKDAAGNINEDMEWDDFYDSQTNAGFTLAEVAEMKRRRIGRDHSRAMGKHSWWYHYQKDCFPSVIPLGGEIGGTRAFATVEDGIITDVTVTDHGSMITNMGETPLPSLWFPAMPGAGPPKSGRGAPRGTPGRRMAKAGVWVGESKHSHDPDVIRASLGYVGTQLDAIEAGNITGTDLQGKTGSDPLAQSFTITSQAAPHGVFITGVDLWFAEAGEEQVTVEIRELINGYPGQTAIPCCAGHGLARGSVRGNIIKTQARNGTVDPAQGGTGLPDPADEESTTTFHFDGPVYLEPEIDYCIVVLGPTSSDFLLWTVDKRGNVLGSNEAGSPTPVEVAPGHVHYTGSLFLSQNAKTWEPDQYKDMMFRFRKAEFTASSGSAEFTAGTHAFGSIYDDNGQRETEPVLLELKNDYDFNYFDFSVEDRYPVSSGQDSVSGITYTYSSLDTDDNLSSASPLIPNRRTHSDDPMRLRASSLDGVGDFHVYAELTKIEDSNISPVIDLSTMQVITLQNRVSAGGFENVPVHVWGPIGENYKDGDRFKLVPADANTHPVSDIGYIQVTANTDPGGAILTMNVVPGLGGRNYSSTPTITDELTGTGRHDGGGTGITNIADFIRIPGETGPAGGNSKFRYISRPVKLKSGMDALDINVLMDVYKPIGSELHVYYKIRNAQDPEPLDDKNWILMKQTSPSVSAKSVRKNSWHSSDSIPMVEHSFGTGSNDVLEYVDQYGNTFVGFKYFSIKIVGFADNSSQVPIVGNLRAMAVT